MAQLFSRYESGVQLTAGPMVGSAVGVSGVNAFVDRLNSISDNDGQILPTITTPTTPIGSVLAWLKSFTNTPTLPDGFVECNGQVLSDADSVYNGQTLPDLNGDNRFLRGNSTSNGTGGSETMVHTHTGGAHTHPLSQNGWAEIGADSSTNEIKHAFRSATYSTNRTVTGISVAAASSSISIATPLDGATDSGNATTGVASNTENRPPYYNIVWIMRIK